MKTGTRIGPYRRKELEEESEWEEDGSWLTGSAPHEIRLHLKEMLKLDVSALATLELLLGEP